jgi:glycosyltransferase involved in cell wall biosynthesis
LIRPKGELISIDENPFLTKFLTSNKCKTTKRNALKERIDIVTLNGDLLILKKYNKKTGEKGVLYITYTFRQEQLLSFFDLHLLSHHYILVIEPSWASSMFPLYFTFIGKPFDVVIQFPIEKDMEFIRRLRSNIIPIKLGCCDWVDHNVFRPLPGINKDYDVIMVANWAPWKGHSRLFKALRELPRSVVLKVALVGFPWGGRNKQDILTSIKKYDFHHTVDIFQTIPQYTVNELLNKSKVNILLSRREGPNRSVFEAMMADVPTLLYKRNNSINHEYINKWTGELADDQQIPKVMLEMVTNYPKYRPRQWALKNMGYVNATRRLNKLLRNVFQKDVWTTDIVQRMWGASRYANEEEKEAMKGGYQHLRTMLRKSI